MNLHSKRTLAWTAALILFLATGAYAQWQWMSLIVPGAILVWIGLVMPAPARRIALQKRVRNGLD
jgi:hypothetical protein